MKMLRIARMWLLILAILVQVMGLLSPPAEGFDQTDLNAALSVASVTLLLIWALLVEVTDDAPRD